MVLINLKTTLGSGSSDDNSSNDEFLYETKLSTKVDDLIESLVNIHNARVRSRFIITTVKELATYGVTTRRIDDGGDEDDDQKVRRRRHCPLSYIHSMTYRMPMIFQTALHTIIKYKKNDNPHSRLEIRLTRNQNTWLIHLGYEWVFHQTLIWLKC
jgi:hypothetical protein